MIANDIDQQFEFQGQKIFPLDDSNSSVDADVQPIFTKRPLSWRFDRNTKIRNFVVSNNVFIFHINEKILQRRSYEESVNDTKGIDVHQDVLMNDSINKIFLDPFGQILLVSTRTKSEVHVLVSSANSLKQSKKTLKFLNNPNFVLGSVCWLNRFIQIPSKEILALLAGQDGSIYEVLIRQDGECTFCTEVYPNFRSIISAHGTSEKVTGIYCDPKKSYEDKSNLFIVITTQRALFYFESQIDKSKKQDFFSSFFANFRNATLADLKYQEFPSDHHLSEFQVFTTEKNDPLQTLLRQFIWITSGGLYYTEIDPERPEDSFMKNSKIIDYFIDKSLKKNDAEEPPKSVALTEFHALMLFPNEGQVRTVCTVNESLVMIDRLVNSETLTCFARDQLRNQLWASAEDSVFRFIITDERRDVWKIFMQKKQFGRALQTSISPTDLIQTRRRQRIIYSKHADFLFEQKKYVNSAQHYAKSDTQFEEVTLKLFALKEKEPLRTYLQDILSTQDPKEDSTQITVLTLWLIDLYLNELNELRQAPINSSSILRSSSGSTLRGSSDDNSTGETIYDEKSRKDSIERVRRQFRGFLREAKIQECLKVHQPAVYDLLTSHGDLDDLILFAEHVGDHERVILLYLEREEYSKALETLKPLSENALLYKYSASIIEKIPSLLIELWKKKYNELFQPQKLLPAMMAYSRAFPTGKEILDYLKFCLSRGCVEKSIHNYLLSEYVKFEPSQIMPYFKDQKQDMDGITYDPRYALQLCTENKLKEESVFLYRLLNMHEEAVDIALEVNVALAKECATSSSNNNEQTKKLWLKIAQSVINEKGNDLNQVMDILNDCGEDLLKIEDILPLFPDFETIDQFKEPIIKSLDRYNQRLNELKTDMSDASKSIDKIRDDLTKYRTRCVGTVDSNAKCSLCDQSLMLRSAFYMFACSHYFHDDCLFSYARKLLKQKGDRLLDDSNRFLLSNQSGQSLDSNSNPSKRSMTSKEIEMINTLQSTIASGIPPSSRDMESVQEELDDLLGSHCVLCGDIAVDNIDQPLELFV